MGEILFVDCETGGTNHETDALIQLSAIIEVDGSIVDEIDLKMKPAIVQNGFGKKFKNITAKALEVQGRTMDDINLFDNPTDCYQRFRKFLARRPASKQNRYIMAGYNADFDCRFINEWFKDMSGGPYEYWNYMQFSPIDVLPILRTMRHYGIIDIPDTKLGTVCSHFKIEIEAHNSMSDIKATRELTNIIIKKYFTKE